MQRRHAFFIFIVCLVAFAPIFLRPLPYGMDSYHFLNSACQKTVLENQSIGTNIAFSLLPCNIIVLNIVYFVLLFVSCLFLAKTATLFNQNRGWLAGIFVFASPLWLMEFWKIENEPIAYTFLFAAAYFFYKGIKNEDLKSKLAGIGLVLVAQTFWTGSVLWLVAFSFSYAWLAIPIIATMVAFPKEVISDVASVFVRFLEPQKQLAIETAAGFGILYQGTLMASLTQVKKIPALIVPTAFFTVIALVNMKFAVHASFFLAIYATKQFSESKTCLFKTMPAVGAVIGILFMAAMAPNLPPSQQQLKAAQLAVAEAKGNTICNDWSTGYWIEHFGGKPLAKAGGQQLCQGCVNCTILSYRQFDCQQINETKEESELKVYKCNGV